MHNIIYAAGCYMQFQCVLHLLALPCILLLG